MADIERARPLLGTRVAIRVDGLSAGRAHRAIDAAFAEVERVHRLLSFHEPDSELSRINREAAGKPVAVHGVTYAVLRRALRIAAASGGRFDPAVAPRLVALGALPRPSGAPAADACADWRDVELTAGRRVRFRRQLWLDLGGIAKGYAVDRAAACLRAAGARGACVEAGGDLRVFGARAQPILLRAAPADARSAVLRLRAGALASSAGPGEPSTAEGRAGLPLDGRSGRPAPARSVCVAAACAWLADALTKPVLADPPGSRQLLRTFRAAAFVYLQDAGWTGCAA
jgi:thiamine biosynthesis lipoprotein